MISLSLEEESAPQKSRSKLLRRQSAVLVFVSVESVQNVTERKQECA